MSDSGLTRVPPAHMAADDRADFGVLGSHAVPGNADPLLPTPALPVGGGAIRGIDERYLVSPARGTGSLTVPLPLSPGRAGDQPRLALRYDSGAGNSPFGLGFAVDSPRISRTTRLGVPRYTDDDVFGLGGDDLVPVLTPQAGGALAPETIPVTVDGVACLARRYRPRIEAAFTRIERCRPVAGGAEFWRTVSRDNVTSVFGRSSGARVTAPAAAGEPERIFEWLLEETRDDRGNVATYGYKSEDLAGVQPTLGYERHRLDALPPAGRYLKYVRYGNTDPGSSATVCFLVVFDYGEHDLTPDEVRPWPVRPDPFSTYRSGFELRTWRLCRRVLMFHHFPRELGPGPDPRLVRATELTHAPDPVATKLTAVTEVGYEWTGAGYTAAQLPPVEFGYTTAAPDERVRPVEAPPVPDATGVFWIDLEGDGLPGALLRTAGGWWYQRNAGGGRFEEATPVRSLPAGFRSQPLHLADLDGDGGPCLVEYGPDRFGSTAREPGVGVAGGSWGAFEPFASVPAVDFADPNLRRLDLDGDGLPDLLVGGADGVWWHRCLGRAGYGPAQWVPANAARRAGGGPAGGPGGGFAADEERAPRLAYADAEHAIFFADLSGDGLADLVRVRDGEVSYWPNLGHGRFGAKVTMPGAPHVDHPDQFDPARVRFGDVDGSGPADLVYLGRDGVRVWPNQAGNAFGSPRLVAPFPSVDSLTSVELVDLLGTGTSCLVWFCALPSAQAAPMRYVDLCRGTGTGLPPGDPRLAGRKPHLLDAVRNNMGAATHVEYAPSTRYFLAGRRTGNPWVTRLPFPVQVVAATSSTEAVSGAQLTTRYAYRHGHYDGREREFCGFGMVETVDGESFPDPMPDGATPVDLPPVRTRSWFHTGSAADVLVDTYGGDPLATPLPGPDIVGAASGQEFREAMRALAGRPLRTEVYADDGVSTHPYSVVTHRYRVRREQPAGDNRHAVFLPHHLRTSTYHYERVPADPRIGDSFTVEVDGSGSVRSVLAIGRPRRSPAIPEQGRTQAVWTRTEVAHTDTATVHRLGVPVSTRVYEVTDLPAGVDLDRPEAVASALAALTEVPYEQVLGPATQRLIDHVRTDYWADDLSAPLPFGDPGARALPHRTYRLAFTPGLLTEVYAGRVDAAMLTTEGGYLLADGGWWAPGPVTGYDPAGFHLPVRSTDPFGNTATVRWDDYHLLVVESAASQTAPLNTLVTAAVNDYRVLRPREVTDPNGNRAMAVCDAVGMVTKTWARGRTGDGDPDPLPGTVTSYDLDAWRLGTGPVWAQTDTREQHGNAAGRWLRSRAYTDGFGRVAMTKVQAEPGLAWMVDGTGAVVQVDTGAAVRWVGTGRTVFNNKALPVATYEPYFSATAEFEDADDLVKRGFPVTVRYDPLGRAVRTDQPDGTFSTIAFTPWRRVESDANDTVKESRWYTERLGAGTPAAQARAATLAAAHALTPTVVLTDSLGRSVRTRADNGTDGVYETIADLDLEGSTRSITDPAGVAVLTRRNDLLGRTVATSTSDAGATATLPACTGVPVRTWTATGHVLRQRYDPLRRPVERWVRDPGAAADRLVELTVYGEEHPQALAKNLRGRVYRRYDGAGLDTADGYDFKGNLLAGARRLATGPAEPDWAVLSGAPVATLDGLAAALLEPAGFTGVTSYDALNRPVTRTLPDGTGIVTGYNPAGLLETVTATVPGLGSTPVVTGVDYDARRRRAGIDYGNGVTTSYDYDELSFRLRQVISRKAGTRLQDLTYTYDPVGNIVEINDAAQQSIFFAGTVTVPGCRYTYDAVYRLRSASGREHSSLGPQPDQHEPAYAPLPHPNEADALRPYTETYTYDPVGNLQAMAHAAGPVGSWTRTYQYTPGTNRLHTHSLPGGGLTPPLLYDPAGNPLATPHLAGLDWDHAGRLGGVTLGGGGTTTHRYDAAGARVRRIWQRGGLRDEHLYLGAYELFRQYRNGRLVRERRTVHVEDGPTRVAMVETLTVDADDPGADQTPRVRFQLANHLGSSALECDEVGKVISYEEYHPFGTTALWLARDQARRNPKRYRYLGKEKDEETGLYCVGARYYLCWLGRWLNPDPAGFVDGPNRYSYAHNNPVNQVDRTGTQSTRPADDDCVRGGGRTAAPANQAADPPSGSAASPETERKLAEGFGPKKLYPPLGPGPAPAPAPDAKRPVTFPGVFVPDTGKVDLLGGKLALTWTPRVVVVGDAAKTTVTINPADKYSLDIRGKYKGEASLKLATPYGAVDASYADKNKMFELKISGQVPEVKPTLGGTLTLGSDFRPEGRGSYQLKYEVSFGTAKLVPMEPDLTKKFNEASDVVKHATDNPRGWVEDNAKLGADEPDRLDTAKTAVEDIADVPTTPLPKPNWVFSANVTVGTGAPTLLPDAAARLPESDKSQATGSTRLVWGVGVTFGYNF